MTICNMSIEGGARAGLIAPDQTTFDYLEGRPHAPQGADWDAAVEYWTTLRTDEDAVFDREVHIDAAALTPVRHLGHQPRPGRCRSTGSVPDPADFADEDERAAAEQALAYMGLTAGTPLRDIKVDTVFLGSCTNGRHRGPAGRRRRCCAAAHRRRHPDARRPGSVRGEGAGRGRGPRPDLPRRRGRVARRRLLHVPGHEPRPAQAGRAHRPRRSNRNFQGRQGKGGRTHLVSPPVAAATAAHRPADRPRRPRRRSDRMDAFTTHTGTAAPLRRANVDTDQIIPAEYLKRITRTGFEDGLFNAWRTNEPDFVLNQPQYAGASILVAGPDFGTGSSREHAVLGAAGRRLPGGHQLRGSPTSSGTTRPSPGCSPSCCRGRRRGAVGRGRGRPGDAGHRRPAGRAGQLRRRRPCRSRSTSTPAGGCSRGSTTSASPSGTWRHRGVRGAPGRASCRRPCPSSSRAGASGSGSRSR